MSTTQVPGAELDAPGEPAPVLKRAITPGLLLLFVTGDILGAGIYALTGEVAAEVGGAVWAPFLLAFVLAGLSAFAYLELVTKYPHAAGAALYAHKAFRRPVITFVVTIAVMASGVTSAATAARAFGGDYLAAFVELPVVLVAIGFVCLLGLLNLWGIKESVRANVVMTLIEVGGLALVIVCGIAAAIDGSAEPSRVTEVTTDGAIPLALLSGATLAFFAFIGFEDSVNVAEETEDPSRAYPRALFGGLAVATVVYLLVALATGAVVPTDTLAGSSGPLLEVVRASPIEIPDRLFSAVALFALANTALINLVMASRLLFGMARQGVLPGALARVLPGRRTPWVAIATVTAFGGGLAASGDLGGLADTTVILLLAVFVVVNVSVLVLRRDDVEHRHYRAPTLLPPIAGVVCLGVLGYEIATAELAVVLRAAGVVAVALGLFAVHRVVNGDQRELDPTELP